MRGGFLDVAQWHSGIKRGGNKCALFPMLPALLLAGLFAAPIAAASLFRLRPGDRGARKSTGGGSAA